MIAACIDDMVAEGPPAADGREHGHYVNMTSRRYAEVACGFAVAADGRLWSVQNFIAAEDAGTVANIRGLPAIPFLRQRAPTGAGGEQIEVARPFQFRDGVRRLAVEARGGVKPGEQRCHHGRGG